MFALYLSKTMVYIFYWLVYSQLEQEKGPYHMFFTCFVFNKCRN